MVFQNYALYPHMTVAKNMGFALKRAGVPKEQIRQKVGDAAALLGISEQLDRKPANLSGGQRQRVAMGRAIVRDPQAFLMDEPLSNLDAKLRIQTRAEILRIQRRLHTTTVYVTHDQVEAMTLGDRLAVMRDGVMQQVGSPHELYDTPRNIFVAGFIGSPSMNFLPGEVTNGSLPREFPLATVPLRGVDAGGRVRCGTAAGGVRGRGARGREGWRHHGQRQGRRDGVDRFGHLRPPRAQRFGFAEGARRAGAQGARGARPQARTSASRRLRLTWWRGSTPRAGSPRARRRGYGSTPPNSTSSTRRRASGSRADRRCSRSSAARGRRSRGRCPRSAPRAPAV